MALVGVLLLVVLALLIPALKQQELPVLVQQIKPIQIQQENAIEIHPDYSRQLAVVDPSHRELWISLGCAVENLVIAAQSKGFTTEVTYPDAAEFINIRLTSDTRLSSPLFDSIPLRQNTRSEYDG